MNGPLKSYVFLWLLFELEMKSEENNGVEEVW